MFPLFLNNDLGHTPDFLSLPPVVSNTITVMTMTAAVMTMSDSSDRRESSPYPLLKTSTITHLSGADRKTNQIKFNVKLYHLLLVNSLLLCLRICWTWWTAVNLWLAYFPLPFQVNESSLTRIWDSSQFSIPSGEWFSLLCKCQLYLKARAFFLIFKFHLVFIDL